MSPAEKSPAENGSAQLVVACVAAHWFDLPAFFTEVDRILCNNGVVAIASFFLPKIVYPENADGVNVALEKVRVQKILTFPCISKQSDS